MCVIREDDLVGSDVAIRIGRFPFQTPLGAWPGFGMQPHFEAPGNLWFEIDMMQ